MVAMAQANSTTRDLPIRSLSAIGRGAIPKIHGAIDRNPVAETSKLCCQFPVRGQPGSFIKAVDGVSLAVMAGEVVGLVGESGCGKTTLARALMRLLPITSGTVKWTGTDVTDLTGQGLRRHRATCQMVFQDPYGSLNPRLTILDTLGEAVRCRHPRISSSDLRAAVAELLEQVGLDRQHLRRYPHEFSGGQRQRIAIARALATEPALIVADEPVSALDVSVQAQILNLLSDLRRQRNLAMLFVSHDLGVVHYLADRIAVMLGGRIVEIGPADAVMHHPSHPYTQRLLASIPQPDLNKNRRHSVATPLSPTPGGLRPLSDDPKADPSHAPADSWKEVGDQHWIACPAPD